MANQQVITIPAGTPGVIEEVDAVEDRPTYAVRCRPQTVYAGFEPRFWAEESELPAEKAGEVTVKLESPDVVYDEDMPGWFREDGAYAVTEEDGRDTRDYLLYRRQPFTAWEIEVWRAYTAISLDQVSGVYRTTFQDGRECERFTLLWEEEPDVALVQLNIPAASRVQVWAAVPCEVEVDTRKKKITIELLFADLAYRINKNGLPVVEATFGAEY
ncbi:MAG: hypothetical protein ACE5EY_00780 [Anaerolineae bacterium]